jgi:hypothetical protein
MTSRETGIMLLTVVLPVITYCGGYYLGRFMRSRSFARCRRIILFGKPTNGR